MKRHGTFGRFFVTISTLSGKPTGGARWLDVLLEPARTVAIAAQRAARALLQERFLHRGLLRKAGRSMARTTSMLDYLEPRLMLTSMVQTAGVLTLHLNTNNEVLQISANGAGSYQLSTSGTFTDGGVAPSSFTGFTGTTGVLTTSGTTQIVIDDNAGAVSGGHVIFNDSGTNSYAEIFSVNLTHAAAGNIDFNGHSTFAANASFSTTVGAINVNAGATLNLNGGASTLQATATGGSVNLNGTVAVTSASFTVNSASSIIDSTTTALRTSAGTASTFNINGGTRDILLNNGSNSLAGLVTLAQSGAGVVRDVALGNVSPTATVPVTTGLAIRNYTLRFDNAGIAMAGGLIITGNYIITSGGDITETGPLTGARGTFTLLGNNNILLNATAGNTFSSFIVLNDSNADNAAAATYIGSGAVQLGASSLGLGAVSVSALNGNITQGGAVTQKIGAAGSTFTVAGAGTQVVLSNAGNRLEGPVHIVGTATTVNVANTSTLPSFPSLPAGVTTLTINQANALVSLPNLSVLLPSLDTLTVTAQGIYQQSGAAIKAVTNATFNAGNNPLVLNSTANDFNHLQVNNSGPNQVVVTDVNALDFGVGTSALGNGSLMVSAGGAITQANRITQTVNAGLTTFAAATSSSITLNNASNALHGIVILNTAGNVSLTNNAALTLGTLAVTGNVTLNASGNAISQDPGTTLTIGGATTITNAGGTVTFNNNGNTFTGAMAITAAGTIVRDAVPLSFGASTVTGALTLHVAGPVSQSAAITAATVLLDATGVTLTNPANDFTGPVSVTCPGSGGVALRDTNAIQLGRVQLGTGTFSVTATNITEAAGAANGLTQAAGGSNLVLASNGSISLNNSNNNWTGAVDLTTATSVNGLNLSNQGNISFVATPTIAGAVTLVSGGVLTLPNAALNATTFNASARQTNVSANITTTGNGTALKFAGAVSLTAGVTLNTSASSAAQIGFNGDVNPAGALTLTLGANGQVNFGGGTWSQGSATLTMNGGTNFNIGDGISPTTFNMVSGTISMPAAPNLNILAMGTFKVGGTSAAETVTVHNSAGNIVFQSGSTLAVGLGTTNDLLAKQSGDTGAIQINTGARLTAYAGLAGAAATPVLDAASGVVDTSSGFFDLTVDATSAAHVFLMGSDIVLPHYASSQVTIVQGGSVSLTGTVTGYEADSDKYLVKATPAVPIATAMDVNNHLDIVVRGTSSSAVVLSVTTVKNLGDGLTSLGGIAVNGSGAASISAATSDVSDGILVQGNLTALTMHDFQGSTQYETTIHAGGSNNQSTTITGRLFDSVSIYLPTVLNALTLADYTNNIGTETVTAERFGIIKTTGIAATSVPGDFSVSRLTSLNTAASALPSVGAVTIAHTLSGTWDVGGKVTAVAAAFANNWSLGLAGGANVHNGNLLGDVGALKLGGVTSSNLTSIGRIASITAASWVGGVLQAASFGPIKTAGNAVLGDFGNFSNLTLTATGNVGGVALASVNVAGNSDLVNVNLADGNAGAIVVALQLSNWTLTAAGTAPNLGVVASITTGTINTLNVDAAAVGAIAATGNAVANVFGDITALTATLHATPGATTATLGTLKATRNLANSSLVVENGAVTSVAIARSINNSNISLLGSGGRLGTLSAAEWIFGGTSDSLTAQSIGALTITGAPLTVANSAKIVGDLSRVNILAFGGGTTAAIGSITVAGSFTLASSGFLRSDNGISTLKVGRDVASAGGTSLISVRNSATSSTASAIGRINSVSVGRWNGVDLVANTLGPVVATGYVTPENPTPAKTAGDFTATNFDVFGATGITSLNITGSLAAGSNILAPGGIGTLVVQGAAAGRIDVGNATGVGGKINALQVGQANALTLRALSVGTIKTVLNIALGVNGGINGGSYTISGIGPIALGSATIATTIYGGASFNIPRSVTTLAVAEDITGGSEIAAGYAAGSQVTTITAGRVNNATLTANSIKTLNVVGKVPSANGGQTILAEVNNSTITLLGNVAGVGLGSVAIKGKATNSSFHVAGGNVTSFAVGGLFGSELLVGFHAPAAGNITTTPTAGNWLTSTNATFALGSFLTTGLFDPTDVADTATFRDSLVAAQKLGTVKINGLDSVVPAGSQTATFGVAFRTASGAGPSITVNGVARVPGFTLGAFAYLGLAG